MKWHVSNLQGKKVKDIELPDDVFGLEMNVPLLQVVVKAYQANRRQGTHATKTRSLVSGGGKKPFKQKGTGGARQGSSRSPLMPGGATAHGPQPRDYTQKINQRMKRQALMIALSDKIRHQRLFVVDDFAIQTYSTKHVVKSLKALEQPKTVLVADERKDDLLYRSARNIHGVSALATSEINAENILRHQSIVLTEVALTALTKRLQKGIE